MFNGMKLEPGLPTSRVAAAAFWFLPFVVVYCIFVIALPPTATQTAAADPLVQLVYPFGGPWSVAAIALGVALAWITTCRPTRADLAIGARFAIAGALVGLLVTVLIRVFYGDTLPPFVPREESSGPGITLGFGAGALEEALFRLGTLALAYTVLRKHTGTLAAAAIASVVTGLAFAASHELGPGAGAFDAAHFVTRLVIPGIAMSAVAIVVHPAFMIAAHCAAHIGIALLFAAPALATG